MAFNGFPKSLKPEPIIGIWSVKWLVFSSIDYIFPFLSFLIISDLETKIAVTQFVYKVYENS